MIATLAAAIPWSAASAAEVVSVDPHSVRFSWGTGRSAEIRARGVAVAPPGTTASCQVTFRGGEAGLTASVGQCPDPLVATVTEAVSGFALVTEGDLRGAWFDLWFVFRPDRPAAMVVSPLHADVKLFDPAFDTVAYGLRAVRFPLHPDLDLRGEVIGCTARLTTDELGNVSSVEVTGCSDPYASRVVEALELWQLEPLIVADRGSPFSAEVRIGFEPATAETPGHVTYDRPLPPNLGSRPAPVVADVATREEPATPPLFVVDRPAYAEVRVHEVGWPTPPAGADGRRCDVLLQVNSALRTWVWPEGCDPDLSAAVSEAEQTWVVAPGVAAPGEQYARLHGTFLFADGSVSLRLPSSDVRGPLPERVGSWEPATVISRVPPRLPKGAEVPDGGLVCRFDVEVSDQGKPVSLSEAVGACPEPFATEAAGAVRRWRWRPAVVDARASASRVRVEVRYGG